MSKKFGNSVNYSSPELRLKQLRDKLGRFTSKLETAPLEILLEEAPRIQAEAKMQVPIDSHTLQNSIRAEVKKRKKTIYWLSVSASAKNRGFDYAEIQHENKEYEHPRGGKPFYIRDPFNEGVERIEDRLRNEVKYDS